LPALALGLLLALGCMPTAGAAQGERAILVREAKVYLGLDVSSQKIGDVGRGREVVILEKSRQWLHVLANTDQNRDVDGWMLDKGFVRSSTPDGDKILFGEAVDSEWEASRPRGRKGADRDAMRLYSRVFEYFPQSPLAGEALYRSADIRWQLDEEDVRTRPSYKERNPLLRAKIPEDNMREVERKFPGTKWADLAAYHLIANKLCGDWEGQSKCPEKESELYQKYAKEHPNSPQAAEALYWAAWRQSALVQIYKTEGNDGRANGAKAKATAMARQIITQYPQTDWAARAQRLVYMVEQDIPTFGNAVE